MPWELPVFTLVLLLHLISEASSRPEVLKMVVLCTQNLFVLFPTAWSGYKVFFLYKVFFSPSISDLPADSLAIVGDLHEARTLSLYPIIWLMKCAFYLQASIRYLVQAHCSAWEVTVLLERCCFDLQVAGTRPLNLFERNNPMFHLSQNCFPWVRMIHWNEVLHLTEQNNAALSEREKPSGMSWTVDARWLFGARLWLWHASPSPAFFHYCNI